MLNGKPSSRWLGFGGLRIPSELEKLTWESIDLANGRMVIHSPKTEHHEGKDVRICPIFPELRPIRTPGSLGATWDRNAAIESIVSKAKSANLRTQFQRFIKRAGLVPWPKLFVNLRASRETELLCSNPPFSLKDVCSWIGNSEAVAMKHYAMLSDSVFQRASQQTTVERRRTNGRTNEGSMGHFQAEPADGPLTHETEKPLENQGFGGSRRLPAFAAQRPNRRRGTRTPDIHGVNVTL